MSSIDMSSAKHKLSKTTKPKPKSDFLKTVYAHKINTWKDKRMNDKCSFQVHLGSGTLAGEYKPGLETRGNKQYFCLKHVYSPTFLDDEIFDATAGPLIPNAEERTVMCQSHAEKVKEMRLQYNRDTLGTEACDEQPVAAYMEVEVPWICDNIFDLSVTRYPGTGYLFKSLPLEEDQDDIDKIEDVDAVEDHVEEEDGKEKKEDEEDDDGGDSIFIFSMILVRKEKHVVHINTTPKKKTVVKGQKFARKSIKHY